MYFFSNSEVYLKYTSFKKKVKKHKWSIIELKTKYILIFFLFLYFIYTFF